MDNTITVTGRGSIHVVPDVTRLEVSVRGVFPSYSEAYAKAKDNSAWMVKILEYNKLNGKLAKTINLDISEHHVTKCDKYGKVIGSEKDGYSLCQELKIDLGMDNVLLNKIVRGVGKFIEGAQINIGYTVRDQRPFQLKMLERAISDATEKAEIMAKAAHCKLGDVYSINYSRQDVHVYSQARNIHSNEEAMSCNAESLDITPDDFLVSDDVTVVWNLNKE